MGPSILLNVVFSRQFPADVSAAVGCWCTSTASCHRSHYTTV